MRTAHDNAAEFGRLTKQGYGVRLAVLVACSVSTEARGGRPSRTVSGETVSAKMTVRDFAAEARVSAPTVSRYLDKWDRMVAAGWDVARDDLTPESVDTLDLSDEFITEFDALSTAYNPALPDLTSMASNITRSKKALADAIKADPATYEAARRAVDEVTQERMPQRQTKDPDIKAFQSDLKATNAASDAITGRILTAAVEMQYAQREWTDNIAALAPGEQRQIEAALNEIIIIAEALKMNLTLDQSAGVTK